MATRIGLRAGLDTVKGEVTFMTWGTPPPHHTSCNYMYHQCLSVESIRRLAAQSSIGRAPRKSGNLQREKAAGEVSPKKGQDQGVRRTKG